MCIRGAQGKHRRPLAVFLQALLLFIGTLIAGVANPKYLRPAGAPLNLILCALWTACALATHPRRRRRVSGLLGRIGSGSELGAAAAVAAMLGQNEASQTLADAAKCFYGLPFDRLVARPGAQTPD